MIENFIFRGKEEKYSDEIKSDWVYGDVVNNKIDDLLFICKNGNFHRIKKETLGLYTFKDDVNDNKIFTGDIIKFFYEELFFGGDVLGLVIWEIFTSGFYVDFGSHSISLESLNHIDGIDFEIVGNEIDNFELLEKLGAIDNEK